MYNRNNCYSIICEWLNKTFFECLGGINKMKLMKRIIAVVLVACTAISLTACQDTTWAYNYEGKQVSSGLYLANLMTAYAQARTHEDIKEDVKDIFKQTLDDKPAKQWIIDEAKEQCDRYIAIENKFDELKLSLTDKDMDVIEQSTKSGWDNLSAMYEKNGIGENTYKLMMTNGRKQQLIFNKYYDIGGLEEVKNENLLVHFKENFASVNIAQIPLKTGDNLTDADKAKNKELEAKAQEWVKLINAGTKTMNEIADTAYHFANDTQHDSKNTDDVIPKDEESKSIIKKDSTSLSEKVMKALFNDVKPDGDAVVIPDTNAIYICKRYDVTKEEGKFDEMRSTVLIDIKGKTFNTMVEQWSKDASTKSEANEASIKRYNPKKINMETE